MFSSPSGEWPTAGTTCILASAFGGGHVTVAVGPRRLKLRYVVRRDLRCRTVMLAERVAGGVCKRCDESNQQEGCRCYGSC